MKLYLALVSAFVACACNAEDIDCKNLMTTDAVNFCAAKEVEATNTQLKIYIAKAKNRYSNEKSVLESIDAGQLAWLAYRENHCESVYEIWSDGTIRGAMALRCKLRLTKERTHAVWGDYLTYIDTTPPLLPEPK
ncbi:MAG: lysozyme inhibitor LprI family protein [Giesbergeria sp.]